MKNIKIVVAIIFVSLVFSFKSFSETKEKSDHQRNENTPHVVEAENMNLTHYKIESKDSSTYIKLTGQTGSASFNFQQPSGKYNIDVRYLSESMGQNTYTMYIGGNQIVAWLGKDRDDQWHMLNEQKWHNPKNILINKGNEIRIEALSENGSFAIFDYIEFKPFSRLNSSNQGNLITIFPEEYDRAIRNPLKGFRASEPDHEYSTLMKSYIKWNELENSVHDDLNKIKEFCNKKWSDIEKKNIKVIPRVAYVEMGIIGEWGEMEWPDTNDEIKEAIATQFSASFQNKLVMIRWPNTYNDHLYNFGYYWDSFAHHDQEYCAFHLNKIYTRMEQRDIDIASNTSLKKKEQ